MQIDEDRGKSCKTADKGWLDDVRLSAIGGLRARLMRYMHTSRRAPPVLQIEGKGGGCRWIRCDCFSCFSLVRVYVYMYVCKMAMANMDQLSVIKFLIST